MDLTGIAENCADLGLAQTIQNGLAKQMAKEPNWGSAAEQAAKQEAVKKIEPMTVYRMPLGKKALSAWASSSNVTLSHERRRSTKSSRVTSENSASDPTPETLKSHWPAFCGSKEFAVLCKYLCVLDGYKTIVPTSSMFHEMRPLGKGAFGVVYLSFKKDTGRPFATKKIIKTSIKKHGVLRDILMESEVLKAVQSRFLVNLHYAWQDDAYFGLVLSLCPGGDLTYLINGRYQRDSKGNKTGEYEKMPLGWIQFYAASMATGLNALHQAKYVYRDLKPQNVLLDVNGQVKISDLGLVASFQDGPVTKRAGTRGFWPPETCEKRPYTFEPDYFSLGVTMFVLFSDKVPFAGKTDEEKDHAVSHKEIEFKHDEPLLLQAADIQSRLSASSTDATPATAARRRPRRRQLRRLRRWRSVGVVGGDDDGPADLGSCADPLVPWAPLCGQDIIGKLCDKDMTTRLGCNGGGLDELKVCTVAGPDAAEPRPLRGSSGPSSAGAGVGAGVDVGDSVRVSFLEGTPTAVEGPASALASCSARGRSLSLSLRDAVMVAVGIGFGVGASVGVGVGFREGTPSAVARM